MSFTDLTLTTMDDKPDYFKVAGNVTYTWMQKGVEKTYTVPKGFETNLASIPAILRPFFSVTGKSRKPAVFHDNFYDLKWLTRKKCDQLFRQMLLERGMGKIKAYCFYRAVRAFGWTRGNW